MQKQFPKKWLEGLSEITDKFGIWQHVDKNGNSETGENVFKYAGDDASRLLQVWCRYPSFDNLWFQKKLPEILLEYAIKSERTDGLFNNYRNSKGEFIEESAEKLYDAFGRWMWAFAEVSSSSKKIAKQAKELFYNKLPIVNDIIIRNATPHSSAFTVRALTEKLKNHIINKDSPTLTINKLIQAIIDSTNTLQEFYNLHSEQNWQWPSEELSYCGAIFPETMFLAWQTLKTHPYLDIAKNWLNFFTNASFEKNMFWPVGSDGWFRNGGKKAKFDQQTIEAGRAATAYEIAYQITKDHKNLDYRDLCLDWFLGKNSAGISLLVGKGVCDAVTPSGINMNQGAESRLSFLLGMSTIYGP